WPSIWSPPNVRRGEPERVPSKRGIGPAPATCFYALSNAKPLRAFGSKMLRLFRPIGLRQIVRRDRHVLPQALHILVPHTDFRQRIEEDVRLVGSKFFLQLLHEFELLLIAASLGIGLVERLVFGVVVVEVV